MTPDFFSNFQFFEECSNINHITNSNPIKTFGLQKKILITISRAELFHFTNKVSLVWCYKLSFKWLAPVPEPELVCLQPDSTTYLFRSISSGSGLHWMIRRNDIASAEGEGWGLGLVLISVGNLISSWIVKLKKKSFWFCSYVALRVPGPYSQSNLRKFLVFM